MAPILSACLVMNRCGDEIDVALRCIQNADLEVSVFLSDSSPEELTAYEDVTEELASEVRTLESSSKK